jgi:CRP-like cAMP-binding protein
MEPDDVLTYLKQIPMFRDLEQEGEKELLRLVPHVQEQTYRSEQLILDEDEAPDETLLILDGRVRIWRTPDDPNMDLEELGERGAGDMLGRQSLQAGDFELFNAETLEPTRVLVLPFRDLIRAYQKSDYLREHLGGPLKPGKLTDTLVDIPLFSRLTDRAGTIELYHIGKITHEQYYHNGEWLFRQGEVSHRLFYILEGEVHLTQVNREGVILDIDVLKPGEIAGETGLLVGDFHDVTATADGYARALYLERSEFLDLLETRSHLRRRLQVSDVVNQRRKIRTFDWLREDEWVISEVQRHWWRLLRQIGVPILLLLLVTPASIVLLSWQLWLVPVFGIFILVLVGVIAWQYMNWRDDYFVLTTQRVVHIERTWPFSTEREETPLDNVQDIYEIRPGLSSNLLNYGSLVLQTAGETVDIDMNYIPRPGQLRDLISEQMERTRARTMLQMRGQIRDLLARRLRITESPEPKAAEKAEPQRRRRFLPVAVTRSVWEYFFPPSWVKDEEGNAILWRRYWLPGFLRYSTALLPLLLMTVGGIAFFATSGNNPDTQLQSPLIWVMAWLFVEAILIAILLWFVEDWRNDYFQLTPSHIILVRRLPLLLQESRHEARLDHIQNLGYEIPSILARVLNYGHVQFETAGREGRFELKWVRRPEQIQSTISNQQYEYRQHLQRIEATQRQQELLSWFATYDELNRNARQES